MEKCSDISFRKGTFSVLRIKPSRILNGAAHVRQEADDERGRNKNKKKSEMAFRKIDRDTNHR